MNLCEIYKLGDDELHKPPQGFREYEALETYQEYCVHLPSRHGPDFHLPQSQITIDSPDFHPCTEKKKRAKMALLGEPSGCR